jgi:transcription elongation GreA/GreB family factor
VTETLTSVGVDELNLERDAVSWISPLGKALLAADMATGLNSTTDEARKS